MQQIFNSRIQLVGPNQDMYFRHLSGALELDEPNLAFIVKNYLSKGGVYIDVGANVGATAIPIAQYLDYGFVYAFEPTYAYGFLEKNVNLNSLKNIKLFNRALGEREGNVDFITKYNLATSHCYTESNFNTEDNVEKIRISKLDDVIIKECINRLDLIKIDVEGFEREVLLGCEYLIKKFDPIFYVGFNSRSLIMHKNESPRVFLEFLYKRFKNLYWIKDYALHPLEDKDELECFLNANLMNDNYVDNLICYNKKLDVSKRLEYIFYGKDLPSDTGIQNGLSIVSQAEKENCLSYGPYVPLLKGKYKVSINLKSSGINNNELGYWEIYVNKFNLVLKTGEITNSIDRFFKIEINFEVTEELSGSLFEIRTFSYGNGIIELKSIRIEKI